MTLHDALKLVPKGVELRLEGSDIEVDSDGEGLRLHVRQSGRAPVILKVRILKKEVLIYRVS